MASRRRAVLLILAAAVLAGGAIAALMWPRADTPHQAVASQQATTPLESRPTMQPTDTEEPTPRSSPAPSVTPVAASSERPSPTEIDCNTERKFCSRGESLSIFQGRRDGYASSIEDVDYATTPKIEMATWVVAADGRSAGAGDWGATGIDILSLRVDVVLRNATSDRTFVFPQREVILEFTTPGNEQQRRLVRRGAPLELGPESTWRTSFEVPADIDGSYSWVAKAWSYEK